MEGNKSKTSAFNVFYLVVIFVIILEKKLVTNRAVDQCTFARFPGYMLRRNDNLTVHQLSVNQCKSKCLHEVKWNCASFDYQLESATCYLSSNSRITRPNYFTKQVKYDYYEKSCGDSKVNIRKSQVPPGNYACPEGFIRCSDNTFCIKPEWICDGQKECGYGSDEMNCGSNLCQVNEFQCGPSGDCIPDNWVCDNENDCSDGADEVGCMTASVELHCTKGKLEILAQDLCNKDFFFFC